jgi:hypothetical protein
VGSRGRHDLPAVRGTGGEEPELASEGQARGGQDRGQAGQELQRRHSQCSPAATIGALQAIHDRAVVSQGEALQTQRGPQEVTNEALQRSAIAGRHDDPGVDVDPLGDRAEWRVQVSRSRRLIGGERQGRALPLAMAEPKCDLDVYPPDARSSSRWWHARRDKPRYLGCV